MKTLYQKIKYTVMLLILILSGLFISCEKDDETDIIIDESSLNCIASDLQFAEGPAFYDGNLFFTDIQANRIYKWNENYGLSVFKENSGGANGLYSDNSGNLLVCEGSNKRVVSVDAYNNITVIADKYNNKQFNEPNDLWMATNGNLYFTDPVYSGTLSQEGEHVYCVLASNGETIRVIDDLVRPNGIIGNTEGTMLYVADHGASKIYQYSIMSDGSLSDKQIFAEVQADGLTTDSDGYIYAASSDVMIFNSDGTLIDTIEIDGTLTNLHINESDKKTLYITTHTEVYRQTINPEN